MIFFILSFWFYLSFLFFVLPVAVAVFAVVVVVAVDTPGTPVVAAVVDNHNMVDKVVVDNLSCGSRNK